MQNEICVVFGWSLTYLYIKENNMRKLEFTENTEILNVRISKALKDKLNKLAKRHGGTASSEIRYLIEVGTR